jgi:hypothetical protein
VLAKLHQVSSSGLFDITFKFILQYFLIGKIENAHLSVFIALGNELIIFIEDLDDHLFI